MGDSTEGDCVGFEWVELSGVTHGKCKFLQDASRAIVTSKAAKGLTRTIWLKAENSTLGK